MPKDANKPSEPLLLLMAPISGEPSNVLRTKASDSTFRDGLDLHEGRFFSSKKELMNKLNNVAFKGNFEFQT